MYIYRQKPVLTLSVITSCSLLTAVGVSSLYGNVPKKNKLGEVNFLDVVKNSVNYTDCITFRAESYNQSGCVNAMLWSRGVSEPEERAALWSGGSGHSI